VKDVVANALRGPWTCATCDYENEALVKYYCQMCGGDRVAQVLAE
jgi:hypothetical protein